LDGFEGWPTDQAGKIRIYRWYLDSWDVFGNCGDITGFLL
jgi:hypothetical protein